MDTVPFSVVLGWMESHGWTLTRIWKPYRVFTKPGRLPILVEVHEGLGKGEVAAADADKYRQILEEDDRAQG